MTRSNHADLRHKILHEAIGIVFREGPERVTMRSLAEKLGYSVATIYIYFRNKDELLKEIALYGFDALRHAVEPAESIEDPYEAVGEAARRYIAFALEQPELYRLMFQDLHVDSFARFSHDELTRILSGWELSRRLYQRGIESGAFRSGDPELEATIGWSSVHGFVQLAVASRLPMPSPEPPSLRAAREALIESRLRALRP